MLRSFLIGLGLLGLMRSAAVAQTCTGLASYSRGPIQLAGHGSVVTGIGIHQLGASLGYGRPNSVFGDVSIASTSADGVDPYLSYGADLGYQQKMGLLQVCPVASYTLSDLPDGFGVNNSASTATIGLAIGAAVGPRQLQIVPAGGIFLEYERIKAEDSFNSSTESDAYAVAHLGVGLVLNSLSIRPDVSIPLGLEGANPAVGVTVGFNFGKH
jgi:hypothetical protein